MLLRRPSLRQGGLLLCYEALKVMVGAAAVAVVLILHNISGMSRKQAVQYKYQLRRVYVSHY